MKRLICLLATLLLVVSCGSKPDEQAKELVDRDVRASLRAYHGAPPVIPHDLAETGRDNCLSCHGPGIQAADRVVAPVTPHPTWTNCEQCHVSRSTDELFVANNLAALGEPTRPVMASPFLPPYIPHRLDNYREEACVTCHTGPGAPLANRPEHGDRANCRQCHIPMSPELSGYGTNPDLFP